MWFVSLKRKEILRENGVFENVKAIGKRRRELAGKGDWKGLRSGKK